MFSCRKFVSNSDHLKATRKHKFTKVINQKPEKKRKRKRRSRKSLVTAMTTTKITWESVLLIQRIVNNWRILLLLLLSPVSVFVWLQQQHIVMKSSIPVYVFPWGRELLGQFSFFALKHIEHTHCPLLPDPFWIFEVLESLSPLRVSSPSVPLLFLLHSFSVPGCSRKSLITALLL